MQTLPLQYSVASLCRFWGCFFMKCLFTRIFIRTNFTW